MTYSRKIVELPFDGGVMDFRSAGRNPGNRLHFALSVNMENIPAIRHAGEPAQYNSSSIVGTPVILAGHDWWPSAGVHRTVIVASDGKIYKDTYDAGTFATTLHNFGGSLGGPSHHPNFIEGGKEVAANNRKLFIMVADQVVRVLSGDAATATAITTPPADWTGTNQPTCGAIHEGRLWGAGNPNDPHRVYYSTTASHEDFTGAGSGSLSIFPGEGEKIVDIMSFKGLLIVWKYPYGVYYVDTTDPTVANWKIKVLTRGTGGVSPTGAVLIDDDVLFIDAQANIHLLSAAQEFGDMTSHSLTKITRTQNFVQGNVQLSALAAAQLIYYPIRREVHLIAPVVLGGNNSIRLVIDFNGETPRFFKGSISPTCGSIWNIVDSDGAPRYMIGNNAGVLFKGDVYNFSLSPDGTFTAIFTTLFTDFAHIDPSWATKRKSAEYLELIVTNFLDVDNVITVTTYWDVDSDSAPATTTNVITVPPTDVPTPYKIRLTGGGRFFQFSVSSTTGFNILAAYLYFSVNDERKV